MSLLEQSLQNLTFAMCWLRSPLQVGAAAPSSSQLGRSMATALNLSTPGPIVELGAGTGAITEMLLSSGVAAERLVIVEREPMFLRILRRRFPHPIRVLTGDARELDGLLRRERISDIAGVVSGLPLLAMTRNTRIAILQQAFQPMAGRGQLVQYTYGPVVPVSRSVLAQLSLQVRRVSTVWANIPPATIWRFSRAANQPRVGLDY